MSDTNDDALTLTSETRTLGDEYDRLDAFLDDLADRVANARSEDGDGEDVMVPLLLNEADEAETALQFVGALLDVHGEDATITVKPVGDLKQAEVENRVSEARQQTTVDGDIPGTRSLIEVSAGVVDAPWLEADGDTVEQMLAWFEGKKGAVYWLRSLLNNVEEFDEKNSQPFRERIAAASTSTN